MIDAMVIHGNAVVMFGHGILITGDSGSGKTRFCRELLERGHQIIADDAVSLYYNDNKIMASAPAATYNKMALARDRIVPIQATFGVGSLVKQHLLHFYLALDGQKSPIQSLVTLNRPNGGEAFELLVQNAIECLQITQQGAPC